MSRHNTTQATIADIARLVEESQFITILTGAGVSAESGIPTFRDALDGLWAQYDPQQLATPKAFARDPELVARWYDQRRLRCAASSPNPGHHALAELERRITDTGRCFNLLTQNVDRLHQRAGSRNVVELHGTLWDWRCQSCGEEKEERGGPFAVYPPRCVCGGLRRPAVVWFGEALSPVVLQQVEEALQCDLFFSLGTSAVVEPAASFVYSAKFNGATTVEINLDTTPISQHVDFAIQGKVGEVLPEIVQKL